MQTPRSVNIREVGTMPCACPACITTNNAVGIDNSADINNHNVPDLLSRKE